MKSERMNRVLAVLESHSWPSTFEIQSLALVASVRDYIRRLRDNGYIIEMKEEWVEGARVCRYKLVGDRWSEAV